MTDIFLAWSDAGYKTFQDYPWDEAPVNLLVSYAYIKNWNRRQDEEVYYPRKTMLDSGAFTVWQTGGEVDYDALCAEIQTGRWDEAVALDAINDPEGSIRTADRMRNEGIEVMPVFHIGEPWSVLEHYCTYHSKVGLSCRFGEPPRVSMKWLEQCYARAYPHLFHSFGWTSKKALTEFPFASADSSTWVMSALAWGHWKSYDYQIKTRGAYNVRGEIELYRELERKLCQKWKNELSPLLEKRSLILKAWKDSLPQKQ